MGNTDRNIFEEDENISNCLSHLTPKFDNNKKKSESFIAAKTVLIIKSI